MYIKRILALIVFLGLGLSAQAFANPTSGLISLAPGDQKVLDFGSAITKVATSDPKIAAVTVSGKRELLLTAGAAGSAVLTVWRKGEVAPNRTTVVVASTAGRHLPFGTQVQTQIRIIEVSKTKLNKLGFYYGNIFNGGNSGVGISPPGGGYRGIPSASGSVSPLDASGFNFFGIGRHSLAIIQALESGGFAYTLAKPSLTCLSGQTASFLSGGEFPVPTSSGDNGVQVSYKSYGVGLTLTPTVINANQIILKVAPEVSDLDFSAGVSSGGVKVPGLRVRRAETTVSLAPGQTFIISGLVSQNTINNSDRVPGLGDIPIIGAFFRSTQIQRQDKEMIMMVTPYIVTPQDAKNSNSSLLGRGYKETSMKWLDMATETHSGAEPIRHGLSW